ncbi:MAG: MMPL family transporter [Solirubrobacterales bacterium]
MEAFGHVVFLRRRWILAVAAALAAAALVAGSGIFDAVKPFGFQDPSSESSRVLDRLERVTGVLPAPGVVLLVEPGGEARAPAGRRLVRRTAAELEAVPGIARVSNPLEPSDPELVSDDRRTAAVLGWLDAGVEDPTEVGERAIDRFSGRPGVTVGGLAVAGQQINSVTEDDLRRIELFAVPVLLLLALLVFRGVIAALIPVAVGALAIVSTLALLRVLTEVVDIDVFALNLVTVLGFGLAIDYSLFMVSRYREELQRSGPGEAALGATLRSSGRMVIFSGLTVAAALASLIVFPQRFLYSIGIGGVLVCLLSAAVVLCVLPALLAALGERVNALSPAWLQRRERGHGWYSLARFVMRRPLPIAVAVAAAMVIAGLPFLHIELTRADASVLPESSSARQVDEALSVRFPANPDDSLLIVLDRGAGLAAIAHAREQLANRRDVARVEGPVELPDGGRRLDATLRVDPYSDAAVGAVDQARSIDWGAPAAVGGSTAELVDQRASISAHVPIALAIVVASTLVVLFLMTGSLLLPVIATAMNLLTVSVTFGVLVFVFQDGRLEGPLGYQGQGALDSSMPILLFATAFGLSTDSGDFLITRVREAMIDRIGTARNGGGADPDDAIAIGLDASGRIITAAALMFAVAMGAFAFSQMIFVKEVAVGTALAVLVDATIVRALLFPALLKLAGIWAWWSPPPLAAIGRRFRD